MILNAPTLFSLFLSGISILLAMVGLAIGANCWWVTKRPVKSPQNRLFENRFHLLVIVLGTLAIMRTLAWPHFYWLLKSYVSNLRPFGVMCAFGVTQTDTSLTLSLQVLKPAILLGLVIWHLLGLVDQRTRHAPLRFTRMILALPLSIAMLTEAAMEMIFLFRDKAGQRITCCTPFIRTDSVFLPDDPLPLEHLGISSTKQLSVIYFVAHAIMIGLCLIGTRRAHRSFLTSSMLIGVTVLTAFSSLLITYINWKQQVAPIVLQLPYHHCIYELITDTPAMGLAAVLALDGPLGPLTILALHFFWVRSSPIIDNMQKHIFHVCWIAFTSELLIVTVHLI